MNLHLSLGGIHSRSFGLDDGERPTVTVAEDVVGLGLVREHVLEAHGVRIQHVPALVLELGVDLDA